MLFNEHDEASLMGKGNGMVQCKHFVGREVDKLIEVKKSEVAEIMRLM